MADINKTGSSEREDEIAAKIASLRKMQGLKSQGSGSGRILSEEEKEQEHEQKQNASRATSFQDLPDWKKQDILEGQIGEAEAFFNAGKTSTPTPTSGDDGDEVYKPKVSTWGLFPRPDNISRTYGGGKKIRVGGADLNSEESKKRDEAVAKKLAAYRAERGIDTVREERHREEIEAAIKDANVKMKRSNPYVAIKVLQSVQHLVSDRSRLGGQVFLSLALAFEAVGKRDDARDLYKRLRRNAFPEVSRKAKQLLQGFEAMEMLKVEDETRQRGFRVTNFQLPNISAGIEDRYETAVDSATSQRAAPLDAKTNALLLLLIGGPLAALALLALSRQ